tara:strand:- start:146 stop:604 length:459 start_codon:yes stop_codon:yes gene_type:complete
MKDLTTQLSEQQSVNNTNTNNTLPSQEVARLHSCIAEMRRENAKLSNELKSAQETARGLDACWNKTIEAHEVTKQRLLGYENEAGVPMREADRKIYLQGGEDYKLNMVKDYMNEYFSVERWANDNGMTFDEGFKLLSEHATQDEFSNWTLNK